MLTIALATENQNKIQEIQNLLGATVKILSLPEAGFASKLPPETGATYEANALIKGRAVAEATGYLSLSDDSGFEVSAMDDAPGVFSARFMGTKDSRLQCLEILKRTKNAANKSAKLVCVLALVNPKDGSEELFRGEVSGRVADSIRGERGFGYDSIFIPHNFDKTFGEMDEAEKMQLSHRGIAIRRLRDFLSNVRG